MGKAAIATASVMFIIAASIVNWNKKYVPYPIELNFKKHFGRMESGQAVFSRFPITKNTARGRCFYDGMIAGVE